MRKIDLHTFSLNSIMKKDRKSYFSRQIILRKYLFIFRIYVTDPQQTKKYMCTQTCLQQHFRILKESNTDDDDLRDVFLATEQLTKIFFENVRKSVQITSRSG